MKIQVSRNLRFTKLLDEEIDDVKNRTKTKRTTATNLEKSLNVLQSFMENPLIAQEHQIDQKSVYKILKQNKFHPYIIHLMQELNEDDFDRRLEFCELMIEKNRCRT